MNKQMRGREVYLVLWPILLCLDVIVAFLPRRATVWLFNRFRYSSGIGARALRERLLRSIACRCGSLVDVREGVHLVGMEKLVIGSRVSVHPMCYLDAQGGISIGDDVSIAHGVTIMSSNHKFDRLDLPIRDQGLNFDAVEIGSNVWIGAGARILAGVSIGSGAVIAAGAVVTGDVEPGSVVGGVPARMLKSRTNNGE